MINKDNERFHLISFSACVVSFVKFLSLIHSKMFLCIWVMYRSSSSFPSNIKCHFLLYINTHVYHVACNFNECTFSELKLTCFYNLPFHSKQKFHFSPPDIFLCSLLTTQAVLKSSGFLVVIWFCLSFVSLFTLFLILWLLFI